MKKPQQPTTTLQQYAANEAAPQPATTGRTLEINGVTVAAGYTFTDNRRQDQVACPVLVNNIGPKQVIYTYNKVYRRRLPIAEFIRGFSGVIGCQTCQGTQRVADKIPAKHTEAISYKPCPKCNGVNFTHAFLDEATTLTPELMNQLARRTASHIATSTPTEEDRAKYSAMAPTFHGTRTELDALARAVGTATGYLSLEDVPEPLRAAFEAYMKPRKVTPLGIYLDDWAHFYWPDAKRRLDKITFIPKYPEHEKLAARKAEHDAVTEFIEFATDSREAWNLLDSYRIPELMALYFKVDPKKLEQEKRAMLAELRSQQC
ncbi:MAG: hypothetical protein JWP57_4252 [Spirosoma sp.]|nr:hypothetical protein [Spirosoma sp.]